MLKWARLVSLRGWVLSLAGFGALSVAGFELHPAAGWGVVGASCLALEALTRTEGEVKP
jgi:hypothetical protein